MNSRVGVERGATGDKNMNRKEAKNAKKKREVDIEEVARVIVDSAIKVHRALGPGLLESAYQSCFAYELRLKGLEIKCEVRQPVRYGDVFIDVGYRMDMLVDGRVIVENKTVERVLPIHVAQTITYLKLSGHRLGFLLNWNVKLMKNGIKRLANNL